MYAKVFAQIYDSSIAENYKVRLVFEDFLKLADSEGVVDMTHEAIARRTNVPIEIVQEGVTVLESPDPKSRTPDFDGRRIIRLDEHRDWGWRIVNYFKFRDIRDENDRRSYRAKWMREKRMVDPKYGRQAANSEQHGAVVNTGEQVVNNGERGEPIQKQKQKQREVQPPYPLQGEGVGVEKKTFRKPTMEEIKEHGVKIELPASECFKFFNYYESNGWKVGRNPMKSWPAAMVNWRTNWRERNGQGQARPQQPKVVMPRGNL